MKKIALAALLSACLAFAQGPGQKPKGTTPGTLNDPAASHPLPIPSVTPQPIPPGVKANGKKSRAKSSDGSARKKGDSSMKDKGTHGKVKVDGEKK